MQWQISVVILLRRSFRKHFEEKLLHVEWALLPSSKVESQVPVIVGDRSCFRIRFKQSFGDVQGRTKRSSRMQGQVTAIILYPGFVSAEDRQLVFDSLSYLAVVPCGWILRTRNGRLPSLCKLVQVHKVSGGGLREFAILCHHGDACYEERALKRPLNASGDF